MGVLQGFREASARRRYGLPLKPPCITIPPEGHERHSLLAGTLMGGMVFLANAKGSLAGGVSTMMGVFLATVAGAVPSASRGKGHVAC